MTEVVETVITPPATPPATPPVTPPAPAATPPVTPPAGGAPPVVAPAVTPPVTPPAPPADWRKELAGDDEKTLKALERIPSQKDLLKSWLEQKALIASGGHKQGLPADATVEQKVEYRKANGIPEKAEDYLKALPAGMVFGDEDKPAITKLTQEMHAMNAPPGVVSKALEVYSAALEEATMARSEADVAVRDATNETLRAEWGPDYKANVNAMSGFVKANVAEADQANFINARMGDGTPVFSHHGMVRMFAQLGRTLNPTGTSTPGGGIDKLDAIQDAIKGYEKRMATKEWFKDTKAQEHYRELVDARDNMTKKRA